VWLRLVPEDDRRRATPRTFAASARALTADLGPWLLAAAGAGAVALAAWAVVDVVVAREVYLRGAVFHGYLEVAAAALLLVERRLPLSETARPVRSYDDSGGQAGTAAGRETVGEETDRFRRQHEELLAMSSDIVRDLTCGRIDAGAVRRQLARFGGKLMVHATMENDALYPRLLHHARADVCSRARMLYDDVKRVYDAWEGYARTWLEPGAIEADEVGFRRATYDVMRTLGRRMAREQNELYPLVDASVDGGVDGTA
jgi:hypothetical protein